MKTCTTYAALPRLASAGAWQRQLALLTFVLLGLFAMPMQGYQSPQEEPFSVRIIDADGVAMPDVDVALMREGKPLARMKTGADGRASVRVGRGLLTLSIHQSGYIPVDQVVDTRTMSGSVFEITIMDVKLNSKYTLRPSISVTNITNHFNALQAHANTADPQYGQFFGNYDRHMRLDLDLVF